MLGRKISPKTFDLAVVGHIVFDHISHHGRRFKTQLGSPCVYASLSARALDASVVVGSKVGADLKKDKLRLLTDAGVDTNHVQRSAGPSTAFKIDYQDGVRRMWTNARCQALTIEDVAELPQSKSLHLGPILNEIPQNVALFLTERDQIASLDAQGYMRQTLRNGRIRRVRWRNRRLLTRLDVLKVSRNEAAVLFGGSFSARKLSKLGPKVILITKAGAGTTVWSRDEGFFEAPAFKTQVRDPTGSGDALVGGMLVTWARTSDLLWAVAVGSAVASFVVEKVSPKKFGTATQIHKRASTIFDSTRKLRS